MYETCTHIKQIHSLSMVIKFGAGCDSENKKAPKYYLKELK